MTTRVRDPDVGYDCGIDLFASNQSRYINYQIRQLIQEAVEPDDFGPTPRFLTPSGAKDTQSGTLRCSMPLAMASTNDSPLSPPSLSVPSHVYAKAEK